MIQPPIGRLLGLSALALAVACAGDDSVDDPSRTAQDAEHELGSLDSTAEALLDVPNGRAKAGEVLFDKAMPKTNGRACGDCHVKSEHRALSAEHVQRLFARAPRDPLFNAIDADDRNASTLTFNNLKHGLVRVTLNLPANMDVIDLAGNVITNAARTIDVWRGVPSIENTSYTADYQYDGRLHTLEAQALAALQSHSQLSKPVPNAQLSLLGDFERTQYSSPRVIPVAEAVAAGTPISQIPNPDHDPSFTSTLNAAQTRGQQVYDRACTGCHGGATDNVIENRAALQSLCFLPDHNGNLVLDFTDLNGNGVFDANPEFLTLVGAAPPEGCDEFMALGTSLISTLGQMGIPTLTPAFNATAKLPQYRFRFYTDATRTVQVTDLPPLPSVNPDGTVMTDARGLPIFGPVGAPQLFSTDPGRAAITGRPQDFQAFDVPQLRGMAHTAPYFHDNVVSTIEEVVDLYSHTILPLIPAVGLLPIHPRPGSFFGAEALSEQEKQDLVAFLKVF